MQESFFMDFTGFVWTAWPCWCPSGVKLLSVWIGGHWEGDERAFF